MMDCFPNSLQLKFRPARGREDSLPLRGIEK